MKQGLINSMIMKKRLMGLVFLLFGVIAGGHAASHWVVDPYSFKYDMTVYVRLNATNQDYFEIAAFCGEDCRGVAQLLTADNGAKFFYLRIRSNVPSGEQIKFCVYNIVTGKELWAEESVTFESQALVGIPSNPMLLTIEIQKGDTNGDGVVDIADAVNIVNYIVGKPTSVFINATAEVNGDGVIDIADAVRIVNLIVGKINAFARQMVSTEPEPE